ncbi:MAG TPA: hypothetical protein VK463_18360 [Desulfomonilaceae bacterium]|nr:hypothetical protein [Desulfomonilaceae bacterium]
MNRILERVSFLWSGQALVGLIVLIAGLFIVWEGIFKLKELWRQFSPYLPFSLPPDVAQRMQTALPYVFSAFVTTVGSLSAVLMGVSWGFSGLGEVVGSRKKGRRPSVFHAPELVAESVRTGQAQYWRSYSPILRILGRIWAPTRFMSPISYNIIKKILRSSLKLGLLAIVIALFAYGLHMVPVLLKKYANVYLPLHVPSPAPLYVLIALVLCINAIIAVTLLPFRKSSFVRTCENVPVAGRGDPLMFFALLEEAAKLLSTKGSPDQRPVRFSKRDDPFTKGTLVENFPHRVRSYSRPAGYLCLPLIFLLLVMGFSRLIHFNRPVAPIPYMDFLTTYFLDYLMEVFFAIGLIVTGLYVADWARKLFDVRTYRSSVVFCHADAETHPEKAGVPARTPADVPWQNDGGTDERFARWAREPEGGRRFVVEACWAEILSESESGEAPRFLIHMKESPSLDMAMSRILTLPFCVSFETKAPVCPVPFQKEERPLD